MPVRHLSLAAAALFAVAATSQAQVMTASSHHATYGIMAGVNFAKLGGENVTGASNRTGLVAGAYADWRLADAFSIRPELLYSMEGAKASNIDGNGADGTLELGYLRLPVLLRYTIPTTRDTHPFLALGPSFGIELQCDASATSGGASVSVSCDAANDQLGGGFAKKTFDVSGKLEAGIDFRLGRQMLTIGGAYSHGFTKTFDTAGGSPENRVWSAFAALGF